MTTMTTAKRTGARAATVNGTRPDAVPPAGGTAPPVIGGKPKPADEARIVLFTLMERWMRPPDAEHPEPWEELVPKDYTIPARPRAAVGLSYLRNRRLYGATTAVTVLLETMIEPAGGYEALLAADPDDEDLATITRIATRALLDREGN